MSCSIAARCSSPTFASIFRPSGTDGDGELRDVVGPQLVEVGLAFP